MRELRDIRIHRLQLPLIRPYRLSFAAIEHYDTILVELADRAGAVGLGEATVLTGYTDETIEQAWQVAREFAQFLAERGTRAALDELAHVGERYPFTATAFGTALEMLQQTAQLGVPAPIPVPLLGLLHATEPATVAAEIEALLAAGYRTIKIKVGFDAERDARLVRAAQDSVRDRAALRLDANQGYSREQGIAFVNAIDPQGIELFEQPCAAADWDSHLAVARASSVPLMLDEAIYGVADIEKAAALKAASFIKVKLMKFVTLAHLERAIARIRELGMTPVLGNGVATDLGCWMEGCVAARLIDNAGEMNGFLKTQAALLAPTLEFRDGALRLAPGYGPSLNRGTVERYAMDTASWTARPGPAATIGQRR